MSFKVNAGVSALANLLALVAAANPAFAAQNFKPEWLIVDAPVAIADNPTADANTTVDLEPQTDVSKTGGVIVLGSKKTITYGRLDLASAIEGKATAHTLDPSQLTFADGKYTVTSDAELLTELLKDLFGLDALASDFALAYDANGNSHAADGTTSTVTISVAAGALVFNPSSAPVVVTLTWPAAVSLDTVTTTDVGGFAAPDAPVAPQPV